ncbi:MAG: hypothetical protein PHZ04_02795 [Patescibacteria group bacterium]|nr:hypothetical protein [Patescibacteria group bacterium]MDD5554602.1 hypothetical protein [Patescibacteria group bacterium]
MKKHFVVSVAIIFLAVMVLAGCGHLGKSMRPGLGPIIGGEDYSYNSAVVTYYLAVKYFIVDGGGEIRVESNFLSNQYLFSLAKEISSSCPYAVIDSTGYLNRKSGKFLGSGYFVATCFIRGNEIEVEMETNMLGDVIITIMGTFPYEELPPVTEKRGYFIILKKNDFINSGTSASENHRFIRWFFFLPPHREMVRGEMKGYGI